MRLWRRISWASLALVIGCSSGGTASKSATATKPFDPWVLEWTDPANDTPAYLANGRTGVRIQRDGTRLKNGQATVEFGEDTNVPQIEWLVDGTRLDPTTSDDYSQALDMRTGVLTTKWSQEIGKKTVSIVARAAFDGDMIQSWEFTSTASAILNNDGPGVEGIHVELEVGVPETMGVEELNSRTRGRTLFDVDIQIDGPVDDEQSIRSMLFYLRQSFGANTPPGPMGLSNDTYMGHIFWDSDVWMFPALAFVAPDKAKTISEYRAYTAQGAQTEYLSTLGDEFAYDVDLIRRTSHNFVFENLPLRYPWESGAFGDDVTEGPTAKGEHVSGDVAWSLDLASDLGLIHPDTTDATGIAVARYYLRRIARNTLGKAEILNVKGVDEWFDGDNCLYTNAVADLTIKKYLGEDVDMYYPRDEKGLLAHDGDERMAYKQASAPLILWPLEREDLVDDPIAFLDLFEGKEAPNGPAMSLSIYALIRARYGDADQAYETWRESWKKYTDGNPLMLFSEKPNRPDLTYFLTGAAGCLNAVIYGFIGVRIVDEEPPENAKIKIENGKWLVVRPNLPKAWSSVTFKGMQVLGKSYDVHCEGRIATITPVE